jgi:hypothetical protein
MSVTIPQSNATLALSFLFARLQSETAARLDPAPSVVFGWRQQIAQNNQGSGGGNRVVLQPGDPSGKIGDLGGAKLPGRNPPPIATLTEIATLYIWGFDPSDRSNTLLQWTAARRLHDVVVAVCLRAFRGRWKALSNTWLRSDLTQPMGAELELVFAVEAMVPDDLVPVAPGGTVTTFNTKLAANGGTPRPC